MSRQFTEQPYNDTVCAQCGAKLPEECDTVAVFNGYCNEFCQSAARDDLDAGQGDPDEYIEDTPCLEDGVDNCDDAGTGEGRWHGRIG